MVTFPFATVFIVRSFLFTPELFLDLRSFVLSYQSESFLFTSHLPWNLC